MLPGRVPIPSDEAVEEYLCTGEVKWTPYKRTGIPLWPQFLAVYQSVRVRQILIKRINAFWARIQGPQLGTDYTKDFVGRKIRQLQIQQEKLTLMYVEWYQELYQNLKETDIQDWVTKNNIAIAIDEGWLVEAGIVYAPNMKSTKYQWQPHLYRYDI